MADGGQGFFKISLSVLPENYSPKLESLSNDMYQANNSRNDRSSSEVFKELNICKRKLYSEGGSVSKKNKLTSVYKLILLCVVPQIKESYDNIKLLFDLTKINEISFKFVADFKLLLIINGQQTATSSFPCPYCFISLGELKSYTNSGGDLNVEVDESSTDTLEVKDNARLKTYGDLRADYNTFCLTGKNKKLSNQCHSVVNSPLFDEDDNINVLQKCIIPELHLLQGFVNHLFWRGLVPLLGREKALLWPQKLKLVAKTITVKPLKGTRVESY